MAAAAAARSFLRSSAPASLRSAAARAASRAGPAPLPRRMPASAPPRPPKVAGGDEQRVPGVLDAHAQRHSFSAHDLASRRPGLQGIRLAFGRSRRN